MTSRGKTIAVAAACTAAGVAAGIAGAAAAPASHSQAAARHPAALPPPRPGFRERGGLRPGDGPVVHETAVILNRAGTHFITATVDTGTVAGVTGDQLQIAEAVGKVNYKTVTLTISAGATVRRNFKPVTLAELRSGDHVHAVQSSDGTVVIAGDGTAIPPPGAGPGPHPHFGAGGPRGSWPPPPGAPGATTTTTTSSTTT